MTVWPPAPLRPQPAPASPPDIAVIIPTYNRRDVLRSCLRALAAQTVQPERCELFVVDDGSNDGTGSMVREEQARFPARLVYLRQDNAGPSRARNLALRKATAPLAVIINDDTIVVPHFLAEHLAAHAAHPAEGIAVLGRVTISPEVPRSLFAALHLDAAFGQFQGREELDWSAFITANISVKRSFLLRYGLFEEGLFPHEDLELGERLRHHGLRIIYRPAALGYHLHNLREADFIRASERDGRALAQWYKKSPHLEPLLFSMGLQGRSPLRMLPRHRASETVFSALGSARFLRLARLFAPVSESVARAIYLKVYQHTRRGAIAAEMRRSEDLRTLGTAH